MRRQEQDGAFGSLLPHTHLHAPTKWSPCSELTTGSGVTMRLIGVTMRLIGGELRVGVPSSAPSGG